MSEETTDSRKIGWMDGHRRVILSPSEQQSLAWLLHATDNGEIISGSRLPDVMRLKGVANRLEAARAGR